MQWNSIPNKIFYELVQHRQLWAVPPEILVWNLDKYSASACAAAVCE